MAPPTPGGTETSDMEDNNSNNDQGKVQKMNQDLPNNSEVLDNYGQWILASSRVRRHQSSQYHEEDVGEGYGKGKSSGPQRQSMKKQTSNGRVSRFVAIKSTNEEEIPQDFNKER